MPPLLKELPPEAFALWKHHPITEMVLQYCLDAGHAMSMGHLERWKANSPAPPGYEDQARGHIIALEEIARIDLFHIRTFYGLNNQAEIEG